MAKNSLTRADEFRVADWMRQHWKEVQEQRPTYSELAGRIGSELGVTVKGTNVAGIVSDLGFSWHAGKARRDGGKTDRLRIVAGCVGGLYRLLGYDVPDELTAIIGGRPPEPAAPVNGSGHDPRPDAAGPLFGSPGEAQRAKGTP